MGTCGGGGRTVSQHQAPAYEEHFFFFCQVKGTIRIHGSSVAFELRGWKVSWNSIYDACGALTLSMSSFALSHEFGEQ
jgi:hypothetical protein